MPDGWKWGLLVIGSQIISSNWYKSHDCLWIERRKKKGSTPLEMKGKMDAEHRKEVNNSKS